MMRLLQRSIGRTSWLIVLTSLSCRRSSWRSSRSSYPTPVLVPIDINLNPGDQFDPHVSGDWVSYTSDLRIRYYNFATGTDAEIPPGSGVEICWRRSAAARLCSRAYPGQWYGDHGLRRRDTRSGSGGDRSDAKPESIRRRNRRQHCRLYRFRSAGQRRTGGPRPRQLEFRTAHKRHRGGRQSRSFAGRERRGLGALCRRPSRTATSGRPCGPAVRGLSASSRPRRARRAIRARTVHWSPTMRSGAASPAFSGARWVAEPKWNSKWLAIKAIRASPATSSRSRAVRRRSTRRHLRL